MATKKADAANVAAAAAASSSSSPLTRAAAVALPLLLSVGAALCKAL